MADRPIPPAEPPTPRNLLILAALALTVIAALIAAAAFVAG